MKNVPESERRAPTKCPCGASWHAVHITHGSSRFLCVKCWVPRYLRLTGRTVESLTEREVHA